MERQEISLEEVLARLNLIILECKITDRNRDKWDKTATHWKVTIGHPVGGCHKCDDIRLERKGYPKSDNHNNHYGNEKTFEIVFSQGAGIKTKQGNPIRPTLRDIIGCVLLDAIAFMEPLVSYEEWAQDYGYDTDSRKGEACFQACKQQTKDFADLVGFAKLKELLAQWDNQY